MWMMTKMATKMVTKTAMKTAAKNGDEDSDVDGDEDGDEDDDVDVSTACVPDVELSSTCGLFRHATTSGFGNDMQQYTACTSEIYSGSETVFKWTAPCQTMVRVGVSNMDDETPVDLFVLDGGLRKRRLPGPEQSSERRRLCLVRFRGKPRVLFRRGIRESGRRVRPVRFLRLLGELRGLRQRDRTMTVYSARIAMTRNAPTCPVAPNLSRTSPFPLSAVITS